ncbi:Chaperone protein DnaJ [Gemmata obscuriglobus]|uniref:J domain-containing protein n=1 Tax=Gemmata obscuriglobus TaxID=114 RepID=A0A2Z3GWC1_9BACT|nr:DnaJ domain-containing protein [Gemmata obscuriglobus]AWM35867.1 J domain-containing protein [Gemmata obscuriglobus]QEG31589.1 Chaperone protein DnaJ [Gemmata obscuriglobus]VTS10931.1 Molecular chaperone DnaJ OS=Dyella jiangningensis GN=CH75_06260 PE=4 SV=1: DnaJ [Gemmata obscuriglobus UQM 2246]
MSDPTRYPLCWPAGRPRTSFPQPSRFKVESFARVRDELLGELKLLGAKDVILSANLRLRQDGLPLANQAQPADAGVAVYFRYHGQPVAFACDRWRKVEDNLQAIRHTIEALRGIARWGTGDMVQAAFTGFAALSPAKTERRWWDVFEVSFHTRTEVVTSDYRKLVLKYHPDRNPGDAEAAAKYAEIDRAYEEFKRERGL